jgi:DNA-binding transcriptional ArsR family regulator
MTRRAGSGIALLADDTRRLLVSLIALRPRHPTELSRELGLSLPAVSRQLSLLARAGLIRGARSRIDRRGRVYDLNPEERGRVMAWLAATEVGLEEALLSRWARSHDASAKLEGSRANELADEQPPAATGEADARSATAPGRRPHGA